MAVFTELEMWFRPRNRPDSMPFWGDYLVVPLPNMGDRR